MELAASPAVVERANPQVPMDLVAKFVRQLSHDERNNLGSIDLQAAFVVELATDPEIAVELKKLRGMVAAAAKMLQEITSRFSVPEANILSIESVILLEDFRDRLLKLFPTAAAQVQWTVELQQETIAVDPELIFSALCEVCRNAFQFRDDAQPISIRVSTSERQWIFELQEKCANLPSSPDDWGRTPLVSTRRGGYGLGLFQVRQILAKHGGELAFHNDPAAAILTTRVTLPLSSDSENGR